jgi:hypothetical protein
MPKKPPKKTSKYEVEKRIIKTMEFLNQGYGRHEILKYTTKSKNLEKAKKQEKEGICWNIKIDMIDSYIRRARENFKELAEFDKNIEIGLARSRLTDLYQQCRRIQDFKTCLMIVKVQLELFGLIIQKTEEVTKEPKTIIVKRYSKKKNEGNRS